jgi:NAD(P)H-hydrate epimerase
MRRMIRLTRAQVREIDRRAIEQYRIPGLELMEHASRAVADEAIKMLKVSDGTRVLIVCGNGNNGGDGLAAARMLHEASFVVDVCAPEPGPNGPMFTHEVTENFIRLHKLGIDVKSATQAKIRRTKCDLLIDALLGTGLSAPPRVRAAELIDAMNARAVPILAIDVPSGLDCDTGEPFGSSCIRAVKTVTFVAEKAGFANPASKQYTGEITVGDIGVPRELIEEVAKMSPT